MTPNDRDTMWANNETCRLEIELQKAEAKSLDRYFPHPVIIKAREEFDRIHSTDEMSPFDSEDRARARGALIDAIRKYGMET